MNGNAKTANLRPGGGGGLQINNYYSSKAKTKAREKEASRKENTANNDLCKQRQLTYVNIHSDAFLYTL